MTTAHGVSAPSCPRPGQLREPLLKALARATNFQAGVFVPYTDILDETIRSAGYDPDDLPAGWDRKRRSGSGGGAGLDRNITLAFRYAYRDKTPPLTEKGPTPGQWGISAAGLTLVMGLLPRALPQPKTFYEPLIKVLGRMSGYVAKHGIPHDQAIYAVMVEIGVNPDKLPLGWEERGSNRQIKAFDRVRWAIKSMKGAKNPLVMQPKRGQWALTEAGIAKALDLNGVAPSPPTPVAAPVSTPQDAPTDAPAATQPSAKPGEPNATSRWLGCHMTPQKGEKKSKLHTKMERALRTKLPVSANSGLIDDHIQEYMLRAIRRNAFRKLLAVSEHIPYSKIVAYCVNSGRTDARDAGTCPVAREMLGARTEKERREKAARVDSGREIQFDLPQRTQDTDGNILADDAVVYIDDDASDFDEIWKQVENVVHDHKPQAWERYAGILAMKVEGMSTKEIADAEGVSRNRAASMIAEARRCVRSGYAAGHLQGFID